MAMHFTENKANVNSSAIKTPFLIEDILDRNSAKLDNKLHFYKNHDKHDSVGPSARNNNVDENILNNRNEKNLRNNSEMLSNDSDEYRKLLHSERYENGFFLRLFLNWISIFSPLQFDMMK